MLRMYAWLKNGSFPDHRPADDQYRWKLCYRWHDLHEIVEQLPTLGDRLRVADQYGGPSMGDTLKQVCSWTILCATRRTRPPFERRTSSSRRSVR
jgi:hypothetical protein